MSNTTEISDRYNPQEVEKSTYNWWVEKGYFKSEDVSTKPPYCVILPPPNVTGQLHMGHALDHTIQDVLVRWKRMSGFNTCWLPGTDHAGIATQSVVEKALKKEEGKTRHQIGREAFVEKVWEWKNTYGDRIVDQMTRLGDSCDWDRQVFTLDPGVSRAVRRVFVQLYDKGYIYKGTRLINWSPALQSALSDLEVEHKPASGHLWHMKYPIKGTNEFVVVATTRPETMLGDTAVCVHPDDSRYKEIIGKEIELPLTGRLIKVIADDYVDKEFGSGVVKITPAHDFNDYEIGKRHDLEFINILNVDGTLNDKVPEKYRGLSTTMARKQVVEDLEQLGLMEKIEPHELSVGHCSRTNCVVEPYLSDQWFVSMKDIAIPAKRTVESGTTVFEPEKWTKTYLHWMNNIQDWCISRQLWWGHRIPAWNCEDCGHITVSETEVNACEKCKSANVKQEEDVLDTWFSSALWPFSTLGWPEETEALKTFYPTNVLVTGQDIIFFWVARMMMMGLEFMEDVPFRTVYIHGLVRDSQGRKLSKSLGNAMDPVELIEEWGADALRFTLLSQIGAGRDIKFSMQRLEGHRNFMNKLWNAARFALQNLKDFEVPAEGEKALPNKSDMTYADQWIISKLALCEEEVDNSLKQYKFSEAAQSIYSFAWHEFCDWYLEFSKAVLYGDNADEKKATQLVLAQVLNRLMRLLHPFTPFISEVLYQKLPIKSEAAVIDNYPTLRNDKEFLSLGSTEVAFDLDLVREVITAVRNIRGENRIKPSEKLKVILNPKDDRAQKILGENKASIEALAGIGELLVAKPESLSKCAVTPVRMEESSVDVIVPLAGVVNIEEEIKRLQKNIEKIEKEQISLGKRLSNENFLKNAPEDVVYEGKKQMETFTSRITGLREALQRLQS
ncbi:MAG: valine--tRNA ligase [Bdellovibrionales bacterium]